ncbi:fasciclin domain-containing protein [Balneola sp. MJW-20]|uniref:fasciclin domain-containing protein n=1 Tax=Gracilimonas aurantiaca TaxID=3234185 RepID=UPI00390B141A
MKISDLSSRVSVFLSSLLLVFTMVSCDNDNGDNTVRVDTSQNIVELAGESQSLSTLVSAIQSAGLADALQGEGPFTVLAPTNDAFAALPEGTLESLTNEQLVRILTYHVIPAELSRQDLANGGELETLEGETLLAGDGFQINGYSNIQSGPILGSNGNIFTIDAVLLPEGLRDANIVDQANELGNYTTLVSALQSTGLENTLKFTGDYTVFAPSDAAFNALPSGLLESLSTEQLAEILTYHVVSGEILSTDLAAEQAPVTLSGESIFVTSNANGVTVNGSATVEAADVDVSNGVIHAIDEVILPDAYGTIVDAASKRYFFSTLVGAVVDAGLAGALSDMEANYTVFAPTNEAFANLPEGLLASLTTEQIAQILQYHVIDAEIFAGDLSAEQRVDALTGGSVYVTVGSNGAFVNGRAEIIATDVDVNNGVIHAIDEVILPNDFLNIVQIAQKNYDLSSLVTALTDAGLASTFTGTDEYTVFAPTNAAFEAAADLIATLSAEQVADVLTYHAAAGRALAGDLSDGQTIPTVLGEDITVSIDGEGNVTLNDSVNVTRVDLEGTNGVIHVIDGVLVPPSFTAN